MHQKRREGQSKWLLRQLLYRHVPRELIERPKQGFAVPLAAWLRGPLRDWAEALLEPQRLREQGFFDMEQVRHAWQAHQSGRQNHQHRLWCVLMFQAWLQERQA
jgi:asparagine synthase (glutamine-hydrolysing)